MTWSSHLGTTWKTGRIDNTYPNYHLPMSFACMRDVFQLKQCIGAQKTTQTLDFIFGNQ